MDFTRYFPFLPVLIGTAVFFVLALILWLSSKRALAGSQGGTDWVRRYSADTFVFTKQRVTMFGRDKLCLFAVAVFALIFSAAVAFLRSYYETGSWFEGFYNLKTLGKLLFCAAGAVSMCWLLQDLFLDNTVAVCGSLLFAASFVGGHTPMALLAVSLLLLLRWVVQDDTKPLFPGFFLLLASDILLAMAASRMRGLVWVGLGYLAVHIYKCIRRTTAGERGAWEIFVTPLLGLLVWLCSYAGAMLGVMLTAGLIQPSQIFSDETLHFVQRTLMHLIDQSQIAVSAPIYRGLLLYPIADAPILMLGFFGFFAAVRTVTDRHEPYALCSVLLVLLLGLTWVLSRQYCLLPGLILCGCCLLRRYTAAQHKTPVVVYTILGCIYYLAVYVYTYLLQGVFDLAELLA